MITTKKIYLFLAKLSTKNFFINTKKNIIGQTINPPIIGSKYETLLQFLKTHKGLNDVKIGK